MAAITTAQEYQAVREAIQTFNTTNASVATAVVDGIQVTYSASQLDWLQNRERELAKRLTVRNQRKRTTPDFSY